MEHPVQAEVERFGRSRMVRFSARVALPVLLVILATASATIAFVLWSARGVDEASLAQQTRVARQMITRVVDEVPYDQQSVAIWDDAIRNTKLHFDANWVDTNLGSWMYKYFGHDEVLIVDQNDTPIYAMAHAVIQPTAKANSELAIIQPLLVELRNKIKGGLLTSYTPGQTNLFPHVTDLMTVDGVPSVVSVVPIVTESGELPQPPGSEYLHVSIVHLDTLLASRLSQQYLIDNIAFAPADFSAAPTVGQLPLANAAGRFVTILTWKPSMPGAAMLRQVIPVVAGAFLVAILVSIVLMDQVWRKARSAEKTRIVAAHQVAHDPLTGLPNRKTFESRLQSALFPRSMRDRRPRPSLLIINLDSFKKINDTLGHDAGDELIQSVAVRLQSVVAAGDTLARIGGDEFAIIHSPRGRLDALTLSQVIIEGFNRAFTVLGSELFVECSIGVSHPDTDELDAREMVRRADIALHEAKAAGRGHVMVFDRAMSERLESRHALEAELREALKSGEQITVAYQPLFSVDGSIIGAEALARWTHPTLGPVSPGEFVPIAEATGLIEELGEFILRTACAFGARCPQKIIAINISPVQMRDAGFADRIFTILHETGMPARRLELEITEGILLEEASGNIRTLERLRAGGIQIALDDFGTGYSSLRYLKRYPVDRIKIDQSFIAQMTSDAASRAIVQAMITLAHALGIEVTAEGIETPEQRDMLTVLGCNVFQGYLMSRPLTPAKFIALAENIAEQHRPAAVA